MLDHTIFLLYSCCVDSGVIKGERRPPNIFWGMSFPQMILGQEEFIMKIESNTTNNDLPWRFGLYQRPSSEENETNSSSGSCHGSDV